MEKLKKALKWFFDSFIWLFIICLAIDIVSKNHVVKYLDVGDTIPLINGFLHITYVVNPAAAFSIGTGNNLANLIIYSIVAGIASIGICAYLIIKKDKVSKYVRACLLLILSGAIGNLIDRLFYTKEYLKSPYGGVVDFIEFRGIPFWNAIFNIADSCIVIAAFMFIVYFIVEEVKEYKRKKALEDVVANKPTESDDNKIDEK